MSLLALALATFAESPVWALDPLEIESTSHFKITPGIVLAVIGTLFVTGLIIGNLVGGPPVHIKNIFLTNTSQPTHSPSPPVSPPQPATPPRAFAGRIRDHRGLSVDTSKARSISDNDYQKMHTFSPDLLNRDHLGEALGLCSRIPDELD